MFKRIIFFVFVVCISASVFASPIVEHGMTPIIQKKDTYKTLYGCIKESFAAFKRSEDNAESADLKGGS